jgi:phosphohistidine phosphatase
MTIYILRHAIAEERRPAKPDEARRLTREGRDKLRTVLACARRAKVEPTLILTSPYARAVETAEFAAEALGCSGGMERTDALLPASSPEDVWREIRRHRGQAAILLSGHEPLLGLTAAYLIGAPPGSIELKKAALASVSMERLGAAPRGVLEWLLTPKLARRSEDGKD